MNFSITLLPCTELHTQPPSPMVKMNGLRPLLTSVAAYAYAADKRAKTTSAFAHEYYNIFLHLFIAFCIVIGNPDTIWTPKHQVLLQFQMC